MTKAGDGAVRGDGFLSRLRRDATGATIAMMGFGMIPVTAMIGSGIDMARIYMVHARLQQACDAGVLAGRKRMTALTMPQEAQTLANNYFSTNFPAGSFGSTNVAFQAQATADGQATATASATIPMTVMKAFGQDAKNVSVSCDARLELSNADIMFVLDVTGSMNCPPGVAGGCSEGATSKIVALRQAVADFYDTLNAARDPNARVRYGFVPYAQSVNAGPAIMATNSNYLISGNYTYQSRVFTRHLDPVIGYTQNYTNVSQSACEGSARSRRRINYDHQLLFYYLTTQGSTDNNDHYDYVATFTKNADPDTNGACKLDVRLYRSEFNYLSNPWPIDAFKSTLTSGTVVIPGQSPGYSPTTRWAGCIEERETSQDATFTWSPTWTPPSDLDIDLTPSSDATRWRPAWPQVVYARTENTPTGELWSGFRSFANNACPKAAQQLQVMTREQVTGYTAAANGFRANGGTYHDAGMLWGARLLSPTGPFSLNAAEAAPNGREVRRHIVFMTDDALEPGPISYSLYGIERNDRRITGLGVSPTTAELFARHTSRFNAICEAAKGKNMTIWVVAFASATTNSLGNCASDDNIYFASDAPSLRTAFSRIASQIAELRLDR